MLHRRPVFLVAIALALCAGFAFLIWATNRPQPVAPAVVAGPAVVETRESPDAEALIQPPAIELAPASQEPTPQVRTPTAEVGAQAAALTLRVEVVDEHGAAVTSGELECAWGLKGFRVTDVAGRVRVPIAGDNTLIKLPMSAREALVVARDSSHAPAQVRVEELRRKNGKGNGRWIADDESFTRDVRIELPSSGPPTNGIWGTIFVDEVPRTPAGLTIQAELSYESMVAAIPENAPSKIPMYRAPETAVIDLDRNEYRIAASDKGAWKIAVKSDETTASWANATVDFAPVRVDLHLTTGATLVLHARDALTKASVPGLEVRLDFELQVERTKKRILGETIYRDATTDATGACTFRGLPRGIPLEARKRASPESSTPMLELTLQESDPREVHHDLWVNGPDPTMSTCWGYLPESIAAMEFEDGSPLTLYARSLDGKAPKQSTVAESKWTLVLPADQRFELYLSHGLERLTAKREIKTQAGVQGPIELVPVRLEPLRFAWTNAPIGRKLSIQGVSGKGVPGKFEMVLAERQGAVELQRMSDAGITVTIQGLDGGSMLLMGWSETAVGGELKVDLMGDRQMSVALSVNGAPSEDSSVLQLVAFDPPSGSAFAFARLSLRSGKSEAVPLPSGQHFFSMVSRAGDNSSTAALVAGTIDLFSGAVAADTTAEIAWRGQSLSAAEWSALGKKGFMLTRCGERDLRLIRDTWRRYHFEDLGLGPRDVDLTLLFDRENCRTVAWDD